MKAHPWKRWNAKRIECRYQAKRDLEYQDTPATIAAFNKASEPYFRLLGREQKAKQFNILGQGQESLVLH